jgi:hypothetical protein
VTTFSKATDGNLGDGLKDFEYPKLEGLILDLRNNGGGVPSQAVAMTGMFLDKNELVLSHSGHSSPDGGTSRCTGIRASMFHGSYLRNLFPAGVPSILPIAQCSFCIIGEGLGRPIGSGVCAILNFWAEGLTVFAFGTA